MTRKDSAATHQRRLAIGLLVCAFGLIGRPVQAQSLDPSRARLARQRPPRDLWARIVRLVAQQLGVPATVVKPDSNFVSDLGADSLDKLELVMALEYEFGVEINDEVCNSLTTPGRVRTYLLQVFSWPP
jgi:acyl carrier protein